MPHANQAQEENAQNILTPAYELPRAEFGRLVKGVRLEFAGPMSTTSGINEVTVLFRADEDIDYQNDTLNFTTLGTIDNDPGSNNNQDDILYGVYEKVRRIQFKFEFRNAGTFANDNLGVTKINIY